MLAEGAGLEDAAVHDPDHAGAGPGHALEESAAVDAVVGRIVFNVVGHGLLLVMKRLSHTRALKVLVGGGAVFLFDDDGGGHVGVDFAEIFEGAGLGEGEGKFVVGVNGFGIEGGGIVRAGGGVGDVVLVGPGDFGADGNGEFLRLKFEVVYVNGFFGGCSGGGVRRGGSPARA